MKKVYPAIFHQEDGTFWLEFPDLEGCYSCGKNLEEAITMGSEALGLYLASMIEDEKVLPAPSDISNLTINCSDIASYICTDVDKYRRDTRAVKKTLSIPAWLAAEAEKRNVSLSRVLQDALLAQFDLA